GCRYSGTPRRSAAANTGRCAGPSLCAPSGRRASTSAPTHSSRATARSSSAAAAPGNAMGRTAKAAKRDGCARGRRQLVVGAAAPGGVADADAGGAGEDLQSDAARVHVAQAAGAEVEQFGGSGGKRGEGMRVEGDGFAGAK